MALRAEHLALALCGLVAASAVLDGAHTPTAQALIGVCFAVLLAWWVLTSEGRFDGTELLGSGLLLWACVSAVVRGSAWLEAKETIAAWLLAFLIWRCCRRSGAHQGAQNLLLLSVVAAMLAVACVVDAARTMTPGAGGFFANPNFAASMLVPSLLALWALPGNGDALLRGLRITITAAIVAGLLTSGSRAALLALVVSAAVSLPRGKVRTIGVVGGLVVGLAMILWRFTVHPDPLAWHRLVIWRAVTGLIVEHPLVGVGPGALGDFTGALRMPHPSGLALHLHRIGGAESTLLGLPLRLGFVGLVLAAAAVVLWLRQRGGKTLMRAPLGRGVLAGIAVICLVHDVIDARVILWWWAALLGTLEAVSCAEKAPRRPQGTAARWLTATAAGGIFVWALVQPALARHISWSSPPTRVSVDRAMRMERLDTTPLAARTRALLDGRMWTWREAAEALQLSDRAIAIDRGKFELWSNLGRVHSRIVSELGPWPESVRSARDAFARATSLEPHLPWSWLHWARLERVLGYSDEARRHVVAALSAEPNFAMGWLFLARIELDLGHVEAAREALAKARAVITLAGRQPPATSYERTLVVAPGWQIRELEAALGSHR